MALKRKILVTGGCGFIGSHFIQMLLNRNSPENLWQVVNLDLMTYAGKAQNVRHLENNEQYHFIHGDIGDRLTVERAAAGCDVIVHFASESHVDRSIADAGVFVRTNVLGTGILMDGVLASAKVGALFIDVSTDEVYGSLPLGEGVFKEDDLLQPSSPYSASKAAGEMLVQSYCKTYGLNAVITRCCNNYGTRQDEEKLIPRFLKQLAKGKPLPLYGDGLNEREWISVEDHCRALLALIDTGDQRFAGEIFNLGSGEVISNLKMAKMLLRLAGKGEEQIAYVTDRLGHDRRYALDSTRFKRRLGWRCEDALVDVLPRMLAWYEGQVG